MSSWPILSSDTHVVEPPDLYTNRLESRFQDRAPRVRRVRAEDGTLFDLWYVNGRPATSLGAFTQVGQRFEDPSKIDFLTTWDDVRPGAYDPHAMVADLEQDGVWGATVQPTWALAWYGLEETELISAICRCYNEWIAEFCKPYPGRLRGIGMVNVDDPAEACTQLTRCAELGLAGAFIPVTPLPSRPYRHPDYERLWATAQDLDLPLLMHVFSQRAGIPGSEISSSIGNTINSVTAAGMRPTADYWVRYSLCAMIFAGVFERHRRLRVGSVEHEASWVPHWLKQMDFTYRERPSYRGFQSGEALLPSDYWRRNMFVNFQEDALAVRIRDEIGIETLSWGNDYPHSESSWPYSRNFLDSALAGVPESERRKLTCDNAAALFKFDLPKEKA